MGKLLTGKKILVMGVANQRSIAWGCAQVMAEQGAELIYTYQNERMKKSVAKLVTDDTRLVECDVASDESIQTAFATIKARFGQLDGLVHAIAYAKKEELGGSITNVTRAGYALAVYGFTGYTVALYALFYPALTGLYTPLWYNSIFLRWFPSWPL